MATSNNTPLGVRIFPYLYQTVSTRSMTMTNESVSFNNSSGFSSSSRPAAGIASNEVWLLQNIRVSTNSSVGVTASVRCTDSDGTTHAVLPFHNASNVGFTQINTTQEAGWVGQFILMPGWKITAAFQCASNVDSTSNWQYTAIRLLK